VGDRPGSSIKKIIKLKMWFLFFGDLLTGWLLINNLNKIDGFVYLRFFFKQ
jgi:hypothetical protein